MNNYTKLEYVPRNYVNNLTKFDVSILIPVYNSELYLRECLNSVMNQITNYLFEVVIVDDGSTDNSSKILNEYKNKYNNIKLITQENKGIATARNVLLENADGEYISFVDSDDTVDKHFIQKMMTVINDEHTECVKCNYKKIEYESKKLVYKSSYCKTVDSKKINKYLWGAIIKKSLFNGVSFPDGYWFEDMIFNYLVLSKIDYISLCEDYLYNYYEYNISASKIQGKKSNLKNLDQFYLVFYLVNYQKENDVLITNYQKNVILSELGTMLMTRTRGLNINIRKQIFADACNFISCIDFDCNNKELFIFKNKLFWLWNINALYNRILQKRGVI